MYIDCNIPAANPEYMQIHADIPRDAAGSADIIVTPQGGGSYDVFVSGAAPLEQAAYAQDFQALILDKALSQMQLNLNNLMKLLIR